MEHQHINIASEKRTRQLARDIMGQVEIKSEIVQTINDSKDGERLMVPAVLTRVANPMELIS